jgi:hypothetical protein
MTLDVRGKNISLGCCMCENSRHISREMHKKLITAFFKTGQNVGCYTLTTSYNICCLMVYVRFQLPEMDNPINVFLFLTELASRRAETICTPLLDELRKREIDDYFLSECLVGCSDLRWRCCDARP